MFPMKVNSKSSTDEQSDDEDDIEENYDDNSENLESLPEYWLVQKLIKYIKMGNQTSTILAVACLKDYKLNPKIILAAIKNIGGLEILINLLETENNKCILGSLSILSDISENNSAQVLLTDLGAVQLLVKLLIKPGDSTMKSLTTKTIYNLANLKRARNIIFNQNGIPVLVDLLDVKSSIFSTPFANLDDNDRKILSVVRGSTKALSNLCKSTKIRKVMHTSGCIPLLAKLLISCHEDIIINTMGIIECCCSEIEYQIDIEREKMMTSIVRFLSCKNILLKKHCASAIYKCAQNETARRLVRENGGLDPLVDLLKDENNRTDKELLAATTGAIWKCAISSENLRRLNELNTVSLLVGLLNDENEEVLKNVAGALSECMKYSQNRDLLCKEGGLDEVINLLKLNNNGLLLENVLKVLEECAKEPECIKRIHQLDGLRLIWSLLRSEFLEVRANAAWALVPCINYSQDSGETGQSLVGGLELLVSQLKSNNTKVLSSVCAAIAQIAKDLNNLAVLTDHGVIELLCSLVNTENDDLREQLALAIGYCCLWSDNCRKFGKLGAVGPLVSYMTSERISVHISTAFALRNISNDPLNCVTLHLSGAVQYLLSTISSNDKKLQIASAKCLRNIRKLAIVVKDN